jgi:hypothetical protein
MAEDLTPLEVARADDRLALAQPSRRTRRHERE